MSYDDEIRAEYFNLEGAESDSSFECYTTAVEAWNDDNPHGFTLKMVDDFSTEEARLAPHTHVYVNINGYGLFAPDQVRKIIAELIRFLVQIEVPR